ncbi:MAG: metal-dependent transcriptional regulator [Synergistaceae bacterium]|jgi:DtxR family Mn-dependent transcriptional regulator|nr:metal-dependent transcriptional regulator [Synergistaceae bacterium]
MITARIEDYLEEIFLIESTGRDITVTDLAERMGITKGTVTATVQKMVEAGMLNHERYGTLYLTVEGRRKGLMVHRRHQGLHAFFHELLGVDRERSSEMACGMEHYMDTVTDKRLYSMVDFFRRAQVNREAWVSDLLAAMEDGVILPYPLSLAESGQKGVVTHLSAEEKLRRRLQGDGFTSGAAIVCLDSASPNSLKISLAGAERTIPRSEAAAVWLKLN